MNGESRTLFWIESALAEVSAALAVVTLVWRDWLEWTFGVDPDQHSGSAEWLIVAVLLTVAVALALFASRRWRTMHLGRRAAG